MADSPLTTKGRWLCNGLLGPVLSARLWARLPLHILRRILAAALERDDVIDDEPRARPRGPAGCRAGMDGLELSPGRPAPCDPAIGGARTVAASVRRRSGVGDGRAALGSGRESLPTSRCGAGAALGGPRRCRTDQEAESDGELSDHHGDLSAAPSRPYRRIRDAALFEVTLGTHWQ